MNSNLLSREDLLASAAIAEDAFRTAEDPTQVQIRPGGGTWLIDNIPECMRVIRYDKQVVGSTLIVPTSREVMQLFLNKKINEAELFARVRAAAAPIWEAIYLCSAVLLPEHRGKGVATTSAMLSIDWVLANKNPRPDFYVWPTNADGMHATQRMKELLAKRGLTVFVLPA